ncbi:hypothetical protein HIM_06127 [Hirsutella minnesotensis 3608]|uniref:Zn(2)-C6 fungal-type domain-containing protein n=1 Tax=Hirsutella minnesotensis 3608 TaxID=1043627 RepID=A0A0F7ZJM0_9HYPO|nr:hypothetical protein HIM_06127 [Hirsutella minnesotensis 3608]
MTHGSRVEPESAPARDSGSSSFRVSPFRSCSPSASQSPSQSPLPSPLPSDSQHRQKRPVTTCAPCRARKVRCDGLHPLCSNCQRLGFSCTYDLSNAEACNAAVPRRRVRQACLSCHSRKARCSGHLPACERCRALKLDCVYRPGKRVRTSTQSPRVHQELADKQRATINSFAYNGADTHHRETSPRYSLDALMGQTFEHFFRHVHHIPMFSFLHRASLMAQHAHGKVDKALLLALVGITSCLIDMGPGVRDFGNRCVDDAETLIFADYTRPSMFKVQALVLIVKHRILNNKFASAFMLFSVASRFAAALRLNHENDALCFLAQESRRRLMWSLYCMDIGIASGHRALSLWSTDKIHISLPCNERNFEFDLPQPAEKLVPDLGGPPFSNMTEDVGSLALHVRIFHIRQRIVEFTRDVNAARIVDASYIQTTTMSFQRELDDFAARLPSSFQYSENSLRLRAYSPRICVFIMIHIWWRHCHSDLYRLALGGFRDSLPPSRLGAFDTSFVQTCQQQCLDHSLAMADIFAAMQRLGVKPVADLDLALCAYQCARMLRYIQTVDAGAPGLSTDEIARRAKVCLSAITECCRGPAAAAISSELETWIANGFADQSLPMQLASPGSFRVRSIPNGHDAAQHPVLRSIEVSDDPDVISTMHSNDDPVPPMDRLSLPAAASRDACSTGMDLGVCVDLATDAQAGNRAASQAAEMNNAYEGALDGSGTETGLDTALAQGDAPWPPSQEWPWADFLDGVGLGGL